MSSGQDSERSTRDAEGPTSGRSPSKDLRTPPEAFAGGLRARALRLRRKMTLDELAAATNLSKGHLSRFERGEKMLSLAALMRLAQALDTSTSTLLGETVDQEAVHHVRAGDRRISQAPQEAGGYAFALLSRSAGGGGLDVFTIELSPDVTISGRETHAGQESFYVLAGEVAMEIGPGRYRLQKGDYIEFPGTFPHSAVSTNGEASVLVIIDRK